MPPNQPMVKGRSNIEAYWKDAFQLGVTSLKLRPFESAISGAQAFEAGTASVTLKPGVADTSKYVVVFKRVGAEWKMAYDVFNSDLPPPGAK